MALDHLIEIDDDSSATDEQREYAARIQALLAHWAEHPVDFVCDALGIQPDPWQCDVLDTVLIEDNIALRACHGVGKTALLSWMILWYVFTHKNAVVPTTAPTFNKQVRDVLWGTGVHKWFQDAQRINPWLTQYFELQTTRLQHVDHKALWFAVGIASGQPINVEGYHSENLLAIFDEAKGISKATWESIQGMRTTHRAKLIVASTPGGKTGEYFKVFTQYRETWPSLFIIHPECLRGTLRRPEAEPYSHGGTYYSSRVREEWVKQRASEWGTDSPSYIARAVGDFPDLADMALIPHEWLMEAKGRRDGIEGEVWVSCDVATYGRDRTVILVGRGGTIIAGETIAAKPEETSAIEAKTLGVGRDPKRPFYRSTVATAEICRRLRIEHNAVGIIVDATGLGVGVVDYLKNLGENVEGIAFGASPTDRPTDAEQRKWKQEKHLLDSVYANIKAEMGWQVRNGFEGGDIALGNLPAEIRDPLIEQASLMEIDYDASGKMRLIDPDDTEEVVGAGEEVRRSPDHFHSLMLLWWKCGGKSKRRPFSGAIPNGLTTLGQSPDRSRIYGSTNAIVQGGGGGRVAGQARWIQTRYR